MTEKCSSPKRRTRGRPTYPRPTTPIRAFRDLISSISWSFISCVGYLSDTTESKRKFMIAPNQGLRLIMGSIMSARNLSLVLGVLLCTGISFGQGPSTLRQEQPPIPVDEIIKKFSEREREFRIARGNYTYRQDVT